MLENRILIIGGGPAGLSAAISAASSGSRVLLVERNNNLGGQLIKQTHKFFGSEKQYASRRGIDIANILIKKVNVYKENIEIMTNTTVVGMYEDGVVSLLHNNKYIKIKPISIIVTTGAFEKCLSFTNNDLPGIYGAGAVQTLMNVHGVKPGNKVLMVGAGNIGLIVTYQLLQAGVKVVSVLDGAPKIGGYWVHASKIRRMGVPILTSHSIKSAIGVSCVEGAIVSQVDKHFNFVGGFDIKYDVDVICISVGLTPLGELLSMRGCSMKYVRELSGFVPIRNKNYETTIDNIFVAGDIAGVEEASVAMVEGSIAGLCSSKKIGYVHKDYENLLCHFNTQLNNLRGGIVGSNIKKGINKILVL